MLASLRHLSNLHDVSTAQAPLVAEKDLQHIAHEGGHGEEQQNRGQQANPRPACEEPRTGERVERLANGFRRQRR